MRKKEQHHSSASEKSPFLSHGAENEVRFLLGNEPIGRHGPLRPPFSSPTSRTDGGFGVADVVIRVWVVDVNAKQDVDPFSLMALQHVLHAELKPSGEGHASYQQNRPPHRSPLSVPGQGRCTGQQERDQSNHDKGDQEPPKPGGGPHKGVPTLRGAKQDGERPTRVPQPR